MDNLCLTREATGFYDGSSHVGDAWPVRSAARGDDGGQTGRRILEDGAPDALDRRRVRLEVRLCDDRLQRPPRLARLHLRVQLSQHQPVRFVRSVLCVQHNVDAAQPAYPSGDDKDQR
jgi:hypothetical protein